MDHGAQFGCLIRTHDLIDYQVRRRPSLTGTADDPNSENMALQLESGRLTMTRVTALPSNLRFMLHSLD